MNDYDEGRDEYIKASRDEKRGLLRQARELATEERAVDRDPASLVWALGVAFAARDEAKGMAVVFD